MNWKFIKHLDDIYQTLDELEKHLIERDYPLIWERVHATTCAQVGRMLAQKRSVDTELAALACSLHDIGRWYIGRQADHARHGHEPVRNFLEKLELSTDQKEQIVQAVINHSDKDKTGSPLEEIVKDSDILDCYWHGDAITKPFHVARLKKLLNELQIEIAQIGE